MSREPKRVGGLTTFVIVLLILGMIAATGLVIYKCFNLVNQPVEELNPSEKVELPMGTDGETQTVPSETTVPPTTAPIPEPETVIATATISSQGDLLMHKPVFATCRQGDGSYNFESIFRYVKDLVSSYDYAIANLETTFGGDDFIYQGNPAFNCPDELADSVVEAGYDMLLTVNNHCGDTMAAGVQRTLEHVRGKGLATLGTQLSDEEPKYSIVDINGIKVGMVAYSWAYSYDGAKVSMNGLMPFPPNGTINFFRNNNLSAFYTEVEQIMEAMKAAGAEATMMQIHWGVEYQTTENETQNQIAQKLCDLGFDVIVGGHPHVVQPMELLTSTVDESHKTVCIYSLGNAVSNQRTGISDNFRGGYTEDGVLLSVTFEKYSDGRVYLAAADVVPTWVNMHQNKGAKEYNILPLEKDKEDQWQTLFELTDNNFTACQRSYERTMGIVGEGLEQCRTWLDQARIDREQYYYDLAFNPEAVASQTEAPQVEVPLVIEETGSIAPAA